MLLDLAATLVGTSLTSDGTSTVTTLIQCGATWTGTINMRAAERSGATNFIIDNSRGPYALANAFGTAGYPGGAGGGGYSQEVIWPPDPSKPVASAMVTISGGSLAVQYVSGGVANPAVTVSRVGAGWYRFTAAVPSTWDGLNLYDVQAQSDQAQTSVTRNSATNFDVFTRNAAGAATDASSVGVRIYHAP